MDTWRAPDVLVLVGIDVKALCTVIPNGPFARYKIANLVNFLNDLIEETPEGPLKGHLRNTRLILVPDDQINIQQCQAPERLCSDLQDNVAKLSVFRFGFTKEMARQMWGVSDAKCEELLNQGEDEGLLAYAEGAEEYFVRIEKSDNHKKQESAQCHYEAAQAIVGLLDPERDARRLNFTKSLSLHWLHEAQWHLQEARRQKKVKLHLVNLVNFASNRLDYLGEWFGWTRVRWAIRRLREQKAGNVEENDELIKGAKALLDASVGHFKELREQKQKIFLRNTHPMDFIDCARLASELAKHLPKERLHLYRRRNQFLDQASDRINKRHTI